jgi:hypothetical protein
MTENPTAVSSPALSAPPPSPEALCTALRALEPRATAALTRRLLEDRALEACAAFYGVSPEAFSVRLLRAGLSLTEALGLPVPAPSSEAEEATWARALVRALEDAGASIPAALEPTVALCRRVREVGPEVVAALEAAEREEADSPRRRREDLLRRLAVVLLLAVTAYLYWTRLSEPPVRFVPVPAPSRR